MSDTSAPGSLETTFMRLHPASSLRVLISAAALLCAAPALAQFRPPPMSDEERIIYQADDARVAAAESLSKGDKKGAGENYRSAVQLYEEVLTKNPNAVKAAIGLAQAAAALGDHARVVKWLEPVQAKNPDDLELAYQLGVAKFRLKQYDGAVPLLEKVAPALKPEHVVAHYYLGTYNLSVGRGDQAVVALNHYLQLRPPALEKSDYQMQELLGRGYLLMRQPQQARAAFQKAQAGRPESITVQMGLEAALELEGKYGDARTMLAGLSQRFPKSPEPKERLGRLWLAAGDVKQAEAVAAQLIAIDQGPTSLLLDGDVKLALKQPKPAEAQLKKAVAAMPSLLPAQFSLARAIQMQGRNDEALAVLEKLVSSGLKTPEVYSALGSTYRRAGRYQEAVATHRTFVELLPQSPEGPKLIGADHFATGQWNEAIEDFTKALTLGQDAEAQRWLALALAHRANERAAAGKLDDAARDLRRAFDLSHTPIIGRDLGAVLLSQKAYPEAAEVLQKAQALPGAQWQESFLLGYTLLSQDKPQDALTAFEKAATMAATGEPLETIYAGWALAKLELGEFDAAVDKLTELSASSSAAQLTQANLPVALVRRALGRIRAQDVAGATKDLDAVQKLTGKKSPELNQLLLFARALVLIENEKYAEAKTTLGKALAGKNLKWAPNFAKPLAGAYLDYRKASFPSARRGLQKLQKGATPALSAYLAELGRAIDRRDGELAYKRGAIPAAEKALNSAGQNDPLNPYVQHNLACVSYRRGKQADAVKAWEGLTSTLPSAWLNLGIDAQERSKDYPRAFELYGKYLPSAGDRGALVKGWRSRLASIYGLTETQPSDEDDSAPVSQQSAP